jgi:CheY-like chemotaxis protein
MPTVLVVDDDPRVLQLLERMVRLEGYIVVTAANAEDGLSEARRHRPDAILLDLRMPVVDGVGFLRRLRQDEAQRGVPVAILTGDCLLDDSILVELKALHVEELRLKPLWREDLLALLQTLIPVSKGAFVQ